VQSPSPPPSSSSSFASAFPCSSILPASAAAKWLLQLLQLAPLPASLSSAPSRPQALPALQPELLLQQQPAFWGSLKLALGVVVIVVLSSAAGFT
jgi:hypothetical protein